MTRLPTNISGHRLVRTSMTVTAAVILLIGLTWLAVATPLLVWPRLDDLPTEPVDALVVLGPPDPPRIAEARKIMDMGAARTMVVFTPVQGIPPSARPPLDFCRQPASHPVECHIPHPSTTRGEAENIATIAADRSWTSVLLLTTHTHVARARWTFERCVPVRVLARSYPSEQGWRYWGHQLLYQTAGAMKEFMRPECP